MNVYCPRCDAANDAQAAKCRQCGHALAAPETPRRTLTDADLEAIARAVTIGIVGAWRPRPIHQVYGVWETILRFVVGFPAILMLGGTLMEITCVPSPVYQADATSITVAVLGAAGLWFAFRR